MSQKQAQVIVLAGGRGTRLLELTAHVPKCLLPVCNQPLILRAVRFVVSCGFEDVLLVVPEKCRKDIERILELSGDIPYPRKVKILTVPDSEDWGTAEALRKYRSEITAEDIILFSCDVVTDFNLQKLWQQHLVNEASLTCLLTRIPFMDSAVPGPKVKRRKEIDVVGIEPKSNRLVYFAPEVEPGDDLALGRNLILRYPQILTSTKLKDCHVCVVNHNVLHHYLAAHSDLDSVKVDFIQLLVKRHLSAATAENGFAGDALRVFAHVLESSDCSVFTRCHQLAGYFELNKRFSQLAHAPPAAALSSFSVFTQSTPTTSHGVQVGADAIVGEGTTLADKVQVKRSVVGRQCTLHAGAKLVNCLLFDHVTVGENVSLSNCILLPHASVGEKSDLKDCIVGPSQKVPASSKLVNEHVGESRHAMMEL